MSNETLHQRRDVIAGLAGLGAALAGAAAFAQPDASVAHAGHDMKDAAPAPVLSAALYSRFESRGRADVANKVLSAMRAGFGGHHERKGSTR